jgi:hypothetical protein
MMKKAEISLKKLVNPTTVNISNLNFNTTYTQMVFSSDKVTYCVGGFDFDFTKIKLSFTFKKIITTRELRYLIAPSYLKMKLKCSL